MMKIVISSLYYKFLIFVQGVCMFDVTPSEIIYTDELFPEEPSLYSDNTN